MHSSLIAASDGAASCLSDFDLIGLSFGFENGDVEDVPLTFPRLVVVFLKRIMMIVVAELATYYVLDGAVVSSATAGACHYWRLPDTKSIKIKTKDYSVHSRPGALGN